MNTTEMTVVKPAAEADFIVTTTPDKIKSLQERCKSLIVKGAEYRDGKVIVIDAALMIADTDGLAKVTEARIFAMKHRTKCAEEHKKLKADAKAECDRLDTWKNENTALIEVEENRLKAIEKAVADELEAIVVRRQLALEQDRLTKLDAIGGIPKIIHTTMQANFLKVATEEAFQDWFANVKTMNEATAEAERLRKEKEEADKIEAKRLSDAKAIQDKLDAEERERQKKADDEQRAALKKQSDELAAKQAELDKKESDHKAEVARIAADQKAAQDKIDAANKNIQDKLDAAEKQRLADMESAKEETYGGNPRFAWRFEKPSKPESMSEFPKSVAPLAKFAFAQNTADRMFHFSFHGPDAEKPINFQMDHEEAVRLHECLSRILLSDASKSMSGEES